jgi:chromosome partitioning protein
MGKVIAFANNKGGVAKTTSVCNIGFALANLGKKVLFIDLDSQANLTSLVSDLPVDEHVNDIMDAFLNKDDLPIEKVSENVDLVPSGLSLATFESKTSADNMRVYILHDLLAGVKDNYDFVLIDCPPALGTITYIALVAADHLVLVTMPESMSYSGMMMVGQLMKDVKENPRLNPNISLLGIIITKYRSNKVMNAYVRKIESDARNYVLYPVIHEEAVVLKAVSAGQRLCDFAPTCKCAKAYDEIAKELINRTFNG